MNIAIKSECDSRVLVYPMLKIFNQYGKVALFSSNKQVLRLIESDLDGGFKNIDVTYVDGDLYDALDEEGAYEGRYDYVIYDNVSQLDYDYLLCLVTNFISHVYIDDLKMVIDDPKTHIIKFGKPGPAPKKAKEDTKKKKAKKGEVVEEETKVLDIYEELGGDSVDDDSFNKWDIKKTDSEILLEKLTKREAKWCKFPTMDSIEEFETKHVFYTPDDSICKEIYRIFKDIFSIPEHQFGKAARLKDTSSPFTDGVSVR